VSKRTAPELRARAVVSDWDNTLGRGFLLTSWVEFLAELGIASTEAASKVLTLNTSYARGLISYGEFAERAVYSYGQLLSGVPVARVTDVAEHFAREYVKRNLNDLVEPLLDEIRRHEAKLFIVSGAPLAPLLACTHHLKVDRIWGLEMKSAGGVYQDAVSVNPAGAVAKGSIVNGLAESYDIRLALGDSEADQPLLASAPYGVVVGNPTWDPHGAGLVLHLDAGRGHDERLRSFADQALS